MVWTILVLLVVSIFGSILFFKGLFEVEEDHVGWDGKRVYKAGTHWSLFEIQMVDVRMRFTPFGVDELGAVSLVSTNRSETVDDVVRGGIFIPGSERNTRRYLSETVATRERENSRHRFVIIWRPNEAKLRTYLKQPNIEAQLAELLRTLPDADLSKYQDLLGITIEDKDGKTPRKGDGVTIADGVEIPYDARDRHVYILGRSGMGKSTLMLNMALQDMEAGKGVAVIDPHGDLVTELLQRIPRHRIDDVILFDAENLPIGLNVFDAETEHERRKIASDVITLFKRLVTASEAPRMDALLSAAVHSLAELPQATFLDIYHLFMDSQFRAEVVSQLKNEASVQFWTQTYPAYPHPTAEQPILSRLSPFAISNTLATITGTTSPLHISEVMATSKILLCAIRKGTIGIETSAILGTLLVSQFQVAAQRRAAIPAHHRTPFYLYIDEFQSFETSGFINIITEARKYQLCLTLANQMLRSLSEETKAAVTGVETSVYFAPVDDDATHVSKALGGRFKTEELLDLDKFEAIMKPGRASQAVKVHLAAPAKPGPSYERTIRENTLRRYPSTPPRRRVSRPRAVSDIPRAGDPLPE